MPVLQAEVINAIDYKLKATLRLRYVQVTGILDTGASINILSISILESCDFTQVSIKPCSCKIATFSGEELRVLGKITFPCSSVDGLEKQDIDFVLTESKSVLFGIDAIRNLIVYKMSYAQSNV